MSAFLNIKSDFSNLNDYLTKYDDILEGVEHQLNPTGKTLREANRAVAKDYHFYAQCLQELKSMERHTENMLAQKKAESWDHYKSNANIDYNTRDLEVLTKNSVGYKSIAPYLILIQEMVGQYEVVVKAFETLSYRLKDLTAAKIAEVSEFEI